MWPWRLCRKILITIILHIYLRKSKNNKSITNVNIHIFSLQENPICFLNPTAPIYLGLLCWCDVGVRHCVQWWHVFPAHKHEKYRSIIFSSKQSRCQVAELTVYFSMTVRRLLLSSYSSASSHPDGLRLSGLDIIVVCRVWSDAEDTDAICAAGQSVSLQFMLCWKILFQINLPKMLHNCITHHVACFSVLKEGKTNRNHVTGWCLVVDMAWACSGRSCDF